MNFIALGFLWYLAFLSSTVAHEAAHAWAGSRLGDPTAFRGGQVSLDPIPHIRREPIGTVVFPILTYATSGWMMGWASTPYDPRWAAQYPQRAAWMALAGPAANLCIAIVAGLLIRAGMLAGLFVLPDRATFTAVTLGASGGMTQGLAVFVSILFTLNVIMFSFNLIPVPPLDGSAGITLLLGEQLGTAYRTLMQQPTASLLGLLFAWRAFGSIFGPVYRFALGCLYPGHF